MKLAKPNKIEAESETKSTKNKLLNKNFINKLNPKEFNELVKEYMDDLFPKQNKNINKTNSYSRPLYDDMTRNKSNEEDEAEAEEREKKFMFLPTIKLVINTAALLNLKNSDSDNNSEENIFNVNTKDLNYNHNTINYKESIPSLNNLKVNEKINIHGYNSYNSMAGNININLNNLKKDKINLPPIKKNNSQINVLAYSPDDKNYRIIYSGGADGNINLWDIELGTFIETWTSHKKAVISMCFDGYYLLSGGEDGIINVWNTFDRSLLFSLKDNLNDIPMRIQDLYMLNKFGILIAITGEKKINFWRYQTRELLKSVVNKKECLCIGIVESYGKILFGTKDRTIIELDMAEILDSIDVKHHYKKAPFFDEEPNNETDTFGNKLNFIYYFAITLYLKLFFRPYEGR